MLRQILTIARMTYREAMRSRFLWVCLVAIALLVGFSALVGAVVVTGADEQQAGIMAWGTRWLGVTALCLFCINSVVRDTSDKVLEMLFALPLRRESAYLGKLLGLFEVAAVIALASVLACSFYAPYWIVLQWGLSLWLEMCVVASFALWIVSSTGRAEVSAIVTLGFYILSRAMLGIVLITNDPLFQATSDFSQWIAIVVEGFSWFLPPLYAFASADWLIQARVEISLLKQSAEAAVYIVLLGSLALLEWRRRQF